VLHPSIKILPVKFPVTGGPMGILTLKNRMLNQTSGATASAAVLRLTLLRA
jgi:hypothetical protein